MLKDQIVEAIRRIRDARAKQFSYDLGAICRDAPPPPKKEEDHGCLSSPPFPTPCHSDHSVLSDRSTFERSATKMNEETSFRLLGAPNCRPWWPPPTPRNAAWRRAQGGPQHCSGGVF